MKRQPSRWIAVALVIAVTGAGVVVATQLRHTEETVFTPQADTYVSTAHPDANYGFKPNLRADATPTIRSYLRFRLDGLSGRIIRAELRLWSRTGDLGGYSVHSVANTSWDEPRITSRNGPRTDGVVAKSGPFGPGSWSSVDVTRLVRASGDLNMALTTWSHQNVAFDSREGVHKPKLVVQTKPMSPTPTATLG